MKLIDLKKGSIAVIKNLNIGDAKLKLHLEELGFFEGVKIEVLSFSLFNRSMLIKVIDCCYQINKLIAKDIEVEI